MSLVNKISRVSRRWESANQLDRLNNPVKRNPSVQLALNGKPVYLHNILMSVSVKREEKDMSGQKSSTKKTDKGVKAKELNVSGIIPYNRKEWLTDLFNLAEAEDGKGEQVKYRVSSITAEAVNMREVQFSNEVQAQELKEQLAWQISFTLREVNSVAEKKERRKPKPKAKAQGEKAPKAGNTTQTPQAKSETPQAQSETTQQNQKDESWSKKIDDILGGGE